MTEPTSPASSIVIGCKYSPVLEAKSKRPAPKPPTRSPTLNQPVAACDQPGGDLATAIPRLSSGALLLNLFFRFSVLCMRFYMLIRCWINI